MIAQCLLLLDERVNPSDEPDDSIISNTAYHDRIDIVHLLLQDPRVDPAFAIEGAKKGGRRLSNIADMIRERYFFDQADVTAD